MTACVPAPAQPIFATKLTEVMTRGLPDERRRPHRGGADEVLGSRRGAAARSSSGPAWGGPTAPWPSRAAWRPRPRSRWWSTPTASTPTPAGSRTWRRAAADRADAARAASWAGCSEIDGDEVDARRLHHVRAAARRSGAIVVLKGDDTLVAEPGGLVAVSPGATPALATAGTGDVLTGVVAALLARGVEPFRAACAAVRLHALAGGRAAARLGVDGVIACDVIDALPEARRGVVER